MERLVERRVFERMQGNFTGRYSIMDTDEVLGEFRGLDFSGNGIRINSLKEIPRERVLALDLFSGEASGPIEETAQIVWQREVEPGRWQAGLKFHQPRLMRLWPLVDPQIYQEE